MEKASLIGEEGLWNAIYATELKSCRKTVCNDAVYRIMDVMNISANLQQYRGQLNETWMKISLGGGVRRIDRKLVVSK